MFKNLLFHSFQPVLLGKQSFLWEETYLENVAGAFPTEVVLAGQDDHWLGEHLQADGANKLFLQVIHGLLLFGEGLVAQRGAHP